MGAHKPEDIVKLIFDNVTQEGVSVHYIVCKTNLDHRTVKKYVDLIMSIQVAQKLSKMQNGFRIIIRSESNKAS